MTYIALFLVVAWLAYANGANDNFKGVATLYGSGTASFPLALAWATVTTLAGSVVSILLARHLVKAFSGAGLLPNELLGDGIVLLSVGGAAAATIMLATLVGMPTSTTHALAGALLGIAWISSTLTAPWLAFAKFFALPLLLSPLLAIILTTTAYPLFKRLRRQAHITEKSCVCIQATPHLQIHAPAGGARALATVPYLQIGTVQECQVSVSETTARVDASTAANTAHYISAGAVCFSRAVNDTPKMAALLLALNTQSYFLSLGVVTSAMVIGGLVQSRRVAETMSKRITRLNTGQGLCANLTTAALVLGASRLGVPVSTTHVSCGSIFGIGLAQRKIQWKTIGAIAGAWGTTLPLAALLSVLMYHISKAFG